MHKIFVILIVLLSYIPLCSGEDIGRDKIELSSQSEEEATHFASPHEPSTGSSALKESEEGTTTTDANVQPEVNRYSTTHDSPATDTEGIVQGTESSTIATVSTTSQQEGTRTPTPGTVSPASQQMGTQSFTAGSPTLSSQPIAGTSTEDMDTMPQGIWGKIGSWMIVFSGSPTITGSPSTTGLIFVPTAFRLDKQAKLNVDFVFTYYIGEFWNKTKEKMDIFNPINRLIGSGDFKYSFLLEKKWIPAAAFGYQGFIGLIGKASSAKEMGGAVSEKSESFGYSYGILSKRFKNIGLHIGSQSGPIGKLINPLSNKLNITSKSAIIAGLDTKICKRKIFVEAIYPQGNECVMINTFIDNFLPFNFTYIRFNHKLSNNTTKGYSISGYFGARTSGFPGTGKKKR